MKINLKEGKERKGKERNNKKENGQERKVERICEIKMGNNRENEKSIM